MKVSKADYQDKDDGLHPYNTEDYYEWWYLDAQFDSGYSCALAFHYRTLYLKPHIPSIQIHIYGQDGKSHVGMRSVDQNVCSASEDHCNVQLGTNFIRQDGDVYKVSMHTRRLGADLTLKRTLPGWKPLGTGLLYKGQDNGVQGWIIALPRADVEGTLYIEGESVKVKGNRGYHDHNWGTTYMHDCFSGWYWARLYDSKYTLIYGWVYPANKSDAAISRLYMAKDNNPILEPDQFELIEKEMEHDAKSGKSFAKSLSLVRQEGEVKLRCNIDVKSTVDRYELPSTTNWPQYYWRFLADYNTEIEMNNLFDKISGVTIQECMILR